MNGRYCCRLPALTLPEGGREERREEQREGREGGTEGGREGGGKKMMVDKAKRRAHLGRRKQPSEPLLTGRRTC